MEYTVVINGKPTGPYQLAQLKDLKISAGTFIKKPGMYDYKEAHEFEELRELLGFKPQQTAPQYFASFDQRLLASVIDYFFLVMIYLALALISFAFIATKTERIAALLFGLPLVLFAKFMYGTLAEAGIKQATIGKRLLYLKVTNLQGNKITTSVAFGRNLAKIISTAPLFFGYLYSFLNKKQQCFHDVIAETLVVKERLM